MKKIERFMINVVHTHPEQGLLVGKTTQNEQVIVKGEFVDIFPTDCLLVYGTNEYTPKIGRYYQLSHYIEKKGENWLIKHLKFEHDVSDNFILQYLLFPSQYDIMRTVFEHVKYLQKIIQHLKLKGVDDRWMAQIDEDFKWKTQALREDVYQLLPYPTIQVNWIEEIIQKEWGKGKKETKATFYVQKLLKEAHQQGHFYLPEELLKKRLLTYQLGLPAVPSIDGSFRVENGKWYLREQYDIECEIVRRISERLKNPPVVRFEQNVIKQWEEQHQFVLANNQKEAVWMALNQSFSVVTGGPGVGKTTVCKCITDLIGKKCRIQMVAPTGRAAKRAQESTGLEAVTVHRLLEYNGVRFQRDEEYPVDTDVLVIDESSMMDAPLLLALLQALRVETAVLFLGDVDQLPSVGPGQVLRDLIQSGVVPVTRLTEIFRQAADSPIIQCAYAVNSGQVPKKTTHPDLLYQEHEDELDVLKDVLVVGKELYRDYHPFDVQILIPMYDGTVGIDEINRRLQNYLHTDSPSVQVGDYQLRLGDKVIQTKNDKIKNVYNGDVGLVASIEGKRITVRFHGQDHDTVYEQKDWHHLQLAYAVTVHRAQGSEYTHVVIPLVESYHHMLQKNLFYTAITRAKKKLWIVYQPFALERAVRMDSVPIRYTGLADKLNELIS